MATQTEWKIGRKFALRMGAVIEGRAYVAGQVYEVSNFGRIVSPDGRAIVLSEQARLIMGDIANWLDDPSFISPALKRLIATNPGSKFIRELVRSEIGVAPAKAKTPDTTEGWMEFIKEKSPKPTAPNVANMAGTFMPYVTTPMATTATAIPAAAPAPTVVVDQRDHIQLRVTGYRNASGRADWSRRSRWTGTIDVPRQILLRGANAVRRWIAEEYEDWLNLQQEGDYEWEFDEEATEYRFEISDWNGPPIILAYQERFAAEAAELRGDAAEDDLHEADDDPAF